MKRLVDDDLRKWAQNPSRKPLLIRGARQVGKSYSVTHLANSFFENFIEINFEERKDLHKIFEADLRVDRIVQELEFAFNKEIIPGKTLIFFDEIQKCPNALMSLRYFAEKKSDLHLVATGSLLEFILDEVSFPVGRIELLHMYPMTFAEFLLAIGEEKLAHLIQEGPKELAPSVHDKLMSLLKKYFFIGGMPAVVKCYMENHAPAKAYKIQNEIVQTLQMDFAHYRPKVDERALEIAYKNLAKKVGQRIKYSEISDEFSPPTLKKAITLLAKAKLIHYVWHVRQAELPLALVINDRRFKIIMSDVGLFRALCQGSSEVEYVKDDLLDLFRGAMAEQYIGQEFKAARANFSELYFWEREEKSAQAEVDYIVDFSNKIYPVEVKSGPSGHLKSLHQYLNHYSNTPQGVVFYMGPMKREEKILRLPLYFAACFFSGKEFPLN
ncbi:MAG: ATP-binding protein [Oligoflexia bacterium]|nr:ATP-binding protein [Oligoflexia bacterium]MBF0365414.1 ATP-binding protein [Oligoflexia bacterium]